MQIHVSGQGVDVGEALSNHCKARTKEIIEKYIDRINDVKIVISKESHNFQANIHANLGTHSGLIVRGKEKNIDVYAAFDNALEKVEKQLRRYKRKLKDHQSISAGAAEVDIGGEASKYVLPADVGEYEDDNHEQLSGAIIAEKATSIDTITVSQAVMKMDLQDLPAVMFRNVSNGRINVVYRREDGNVSWVDPADSAAEKVA